MKKNYFLIKVICIFSLFFSNAIGKEKNYLNEGIKLFKKDKMKAVLFALSIVVFQFSIIILVSLLPVIISVLMSFRLELLYNPDVSKWILSAGMLLGRLELFAVLVLFFPSFWRNLLLESKK